MPKITNALKKRKKLGPKEILSCSKKKIQLKKYEKLSSLRVEVMTPCITLPRITTGARHGYC